MSRTVFFVLIAVLLSGGESLLAQAEFKRGDADGDGCVEFADSEFIMDALFMFDAPQPQCMAAADVNSDGIFSVQDSLMLLSWLTVAGAPPPGPPGPDTCGPDIDAPSLGCVTYESCAPCQDVTASLNATSTLGVPGQSGAPHFIHGSFDAPILGYSIAVTFDPAILLVDSVDLVGTVASEAEFFAPTSGIGFLFVGVVLDIGDPGATGDPIDAEIPASIDVPLLRTLYSISPAAIPGTNALIELMPEYAGPAELILTVLTVAPGISVFPSLHSGVFHIVATGLFERGDSNADGMIDIGDPISTLEHLFGGGAAPSCADAGDANDDGVLDLADAIYTLGYLFSWGAPPPPPFGICGLDLTSDELDCVEFDLCP